MPPKDTGRMTNSGQADQNQGVQSMQVLVVNFFVFLKLNCFALFLL